MNTTATWKKLLFILTVGFDFHMTDIETCGPLLMDEQSQDNQLKPTYSSSVPLRDVTLKIYREQWTIERGGERGSYDWYRNLWTPSHGRAKPGQPAQTYMQQLCANTRFNPEDLPGATDDREGWWERVIRLIWKPVGPFTWTSKGRTTSLNLHTAALCRYEM